MKKSLTRVLSLVLVLVMMLGVMPVASAANAADYTPSIKTQLSNATVTLSDGTATGDLFCEFQRNGYGGTGSYTWAADAGLTVTQGSVPNSASFSASAAGTYNVSCTWSYQEWTGTPEGADAAVTIPAGSLTTTCTVTVKNPASAIASVSVKEATTLRVGGATETLSATVTLAEGAPAETAKTVKWSVASGDAATVSADGVLTAAKKGTAVIRATSTEDETKYDECTVTVNPAALSTVAITGTGVADGKVTLKKGQILELSALLNEGAEANVSWSSSGAVTAVATTGMVMVTPGTTKTTGTVTVTAVDKYDSTIKKTASIVVTVEAGVYTMTMVPDTLSLVPGTSTSTPLAVKVVNNTTRQEVTGLTFTWDTEDATIATVSNGVVTAGTKNGTTVITASTVIDGATYTATCIVTVSSGSIVADNVNVVSSGSTATNTATVTAVYKDATGKANTSVVLTYAYGTTTGTVPATGSFAVTGVGAGIIPVTITAKIGDTTLATKIVYVSFYNTNDISVTMSASAGIMLEFDDKTDIASATLNSNTNTSYLTLANMMLSGIVSNAQNSTDRVVFDTSFDRAQSIGKFVNGYYFTNNYALASQLGTMDFQVTGGAGGKYILSYSVESSAYTGVIIGTGTVTIYFGEASGDIVYSTTYNKPVTFAEADFAAFWAKAKKTSNLSYVAFNTNTFLNSTTYGKLYTKPNTTSSTYYAYSTDKFYYGIYTDNSVYAEDLGSATYAPNSALTSEYSVNIPFVCYGTNNSETLSGVVTVKLNEKAADIYSRGLVFGSDYDDDIAAAYKTSTGKTLGYVIFTLPDVKDGTLYYSIPSSDGYSKVAQAKKLLSGAYLYYEKTTGKNMLYNAAFVPAAGKSGKVTLSYTAYDSAGNNAYNGTLSLNVVSRTASAVFTDVNAKNYSWASDSVDFLYYEGTAQGSNGKYNPAANITRQDFMLMLYRAFLAEDYGTFKPTSNFPDVPVGTTAYAKEIYQAVGVAKYLGIAQGTNNKFNPKSNITRQEAMVLIYRTLETINKDLRTTSGVKLTSMKDASKISSWATTAISNLVGHGVIQGSNDYIKPMDPISRAEMAAILHRVITY